MFSLSRQGDTSEKGGKTRKLTINVPVSFCCKIIGLSLTFRYCLESTFSRLYATAYWSNKSAVPCVEEAGFIKSAFIREAMSIAKQGFLGSLV